MPDTSTTWLPTLLTEEQTAEWIGVRPRTLRAWREDGSGPSFLKNGRVIRYPVDGLRKWMEKRTTKAEATA